MLRRSAGKHTDTEFPAGAGLTSVNSPKQAEPAVTVDSDEEDRDEKFIVKDEVSDYDPAGMTDEPMYHDAEDLEV